MSRNPQGEPRTGHYAVGLRDGGSEWHVGVRDRRDCSRCTPPGRAEAAAPVEGLPSVHVHDLCPPDRHIEWIDRAAALRAIESPVHPETARVDPSECQHPMAARIAVPKVGGGLTVGCTACGMVPIPPDAP